MSKQEQPVIIIRRKKKGGHGGHHGGAWKVAYADFVTAMMSFFLLLWLLNTTTSDQRKGLADYFAPAGVSKSQGGAGGLLAGQSFSTHGARMSDRSPPGTEDRVMPHESSADEDAREGSGGPSAENVLEEKLAKAVAEAQKAEKEAAQAELSGEIAEAAKAAEAIKREEALFKEAEVILRTSLATAPELQDLAQSIVIDRTPEGLRIQLIDRDKFSMFPSGSSVPYQKGRDLLRLIGRVIARLPNQISITGHTDSAPYPAGSRRSNWDLSTDRANQSRSEIMAAGVADDRIARVAGLADRDSFIRGDKMDPRNRRISIVLLRKALKPASSGAVKTTEPTTIPSSEKTTQSVP